MIFSLPKIIVRAILSSPIAAYLINFLLPVAVYFETGLTTAITSFFIIFMLIGLSVDIQKVNKRINKKRVDSLDDMFKHMLKDLEKGGKKGKFSNSRMPDDANVIFEDENVKVSAMKIDPNSPEDIEKLKAIGLTIEDLEKMAESGELGTVIKTPENTTKH